MAAELESNRRQLQEANLNLEDRRLQMETILESIPSGVLSLDGAGQVTRVNAALIRMFQPKGVSQPGPQTGLRLSELFPSEAGARRGGRHLAAGAQGRPHGNHDGADGDSLRRLGAGGGRNRGFDDRLRTDAAAGIRDRLRRSERPAEGAEAGRLARGGAPCGARDQESADPDCAVGRTHPAAHRARSARRGHVADHHGELRGYHRQRGGDGAPAGGRVLHPGPLPAVAAAPVRPEPDCVKCDGAVRRAAGGRGRATGAGRRTCRA